MEVKQPGLIADHSPPSNATSRIMGLYFHFPILPDGVVLR
jgi:hypothetical protein